MLPSALNKPGMGYSPQVTDSTTRFEDIAMDVEPFFLTFTDVGMYDAAQSCDVPLVGVEMEDLDNSWTCCSTRPLLDHGPVIRRSK